MLFAIAENYRADDPTRGVRAAKPAIKSAGHMTWGDEQIAAYRNKHRIGTVARTAIELLQSSRNLCLRSTQADGGRRWPDVRQRRPQQTSRRKNRTPSAGALGVGVCCLIRLSSLSGRGERGTAQLGLEGRFKCRSRPTSINPSSERSFCWYRAQPARRSVNMALARSGEIKVTMLE